MRPTALEWYLWTNLGVTLAQIWDLSLCKMKYINCDFCWKVLQRVSASWCVIFLQGALKSGEPLPSRLKRLLGDKLYQRIKAKLGDGSRHNTVQLPITIQAKLAMKHAIYHVELHVFFLPVFGAALRYGLWVELVHVSNWIYFLPILSRYMRGMLMTLGTQTMLGLKPLFSTFTWTVLGPSWMNWTAWYTFLFLTNCFHRGVILECCQEFVKYLFIMSLSDFVRQKMRIFLSFNFPGSHQSNVIWADSVERGQQQDTSVHIPKRSSSVGCQAPPDSVLIRTSLKLVILWDNHKHSWFCWRGALQ